MTLKLWTKACTSQLLEVKLIYLSTHTRLDISFAVSNVAKFCSRPIKEHLTAVKRIMRYLKGSTSCSLLYSETVQRILWATQMPIGVVILMTTYQQQVMFSNSEELWLVRKSKK